MHPYIFVKGSLPRIHQMSLLLGRREECGGRHQYWRGMSLFIYFFYHRLVLVIVHLQASSLLWNYVQIDLVFCLYRKQCLGGTPVWPGSVFPSFVLK